MIWSASRANLKPPSGPRWLVTSPPRRRSERMAPRNLAGRSCSWARCSALTDTSLAARVSSARMAYSVLAGICILPFCRTAAHSRATPRVDLVFALDRRHLYLCVPHREDLADVPAGGPARWRRRGPTAREGPRRRRRGSPTPTLMVPICHDFGVPFIMNDSPELAARRSAPTASTWVKRTSACRAVANSSAPTRSSGCRRTRPHEFDDALNQSATYFSAGPIVATPTKPGRAGTGRRLRRGEPGPQRPPGLRHRRRQRRQRRRARRRRTSSLRRRARTDRSERPRRSGATNPRRTRRRRSQRCRSSQPNNVATIRGSARS